MKKEQKILINRINELCKEKGYSYYMLSYISAVPLTTLTHIMNGTTQNPGIFTIIKLCEGFGVTLQEFFDTEEFAKMTSEMQTVRENG